VVSVTPTSFRLVTLEGHLEAGQVEFRAWPDCDLVFCVESWARSGDRLSSFLYGRLHMAKEVQLHMWTSVLERGAKLAGGRIIGGIDIETRRVDGDEPRLGDPEARKGLDELHDRNLNFDAARRDEITTDNGWRIDHYARALPSESPGPPLAGASWETACRLMRDYEFADPKIVRAVFRPDDPLEGRDMLLEARFHGLRFHLGVRVGGVLDETREIDGRPVRVWGWNYSTLQGHLEMGQIDYEVWKWTDTGQVEFHVSCFSRAAPVANPILRLGFRLFGRREQVRFARHACDRMARLTAAALRDGDAAKEIPRAGEEIRVGSSSDGRPH